jgi:hypothetical protein
MREVLDPNDYYAVDDLIDVLRHFTVATDDVYTEPRTKLYCMVTGCPYSELLGYGSLDDIVEYAAVHWGRVHA